MRSSLILFFSILVTLAIVAPSVATLLDLDKDTAILIDFNEEENKKEEKKELDEKDTFFHAEFFSASTLEMTPFNLVSTYAKGYNTNTLEIFLPPPKFMG